MKIALLSQILPPSYSGQAMLIYRLLKDRSPDEYCLISQDDYSAPAAQEYVPKLPGTYRRLSQRRLIPRGQRLGAVKRLNVSLLARRLARIVREEGCEAVVAFSGNLTDLPVGHAASRILGLPFYAYVCDYYSRQHFDAHARSFATRAEPAVLRGARRVVVLNEFLRDELKRRYGVEPSLIYNPCDLEPYESGRAGGGGDGDGVRQIVYTGAVYEAHFDAFRNLVRAVESLRRPDLRLHLYTSQSPRQLGERGVSGPVVVHDMVPGSQVPEIQKRADILFLPLAFDSPYPEIIKTSAPFKMGEYLAAGRPVLVHAPEDSFLAWYFRRHECGVVVGESDPARLAAAIGRITDDAGLRRKLAANAWERARADFSIAGAQEKFARLVGLDGGGGG